MGLHLTMPVETFSFQLPFYETFSEVSTGWKYPTGKISTCLEISLDELSNMTKTHGSLPA